MWVTCSALDAERDCEGVGNGIYCEWMEDDQPRFEVFRPSQLVVVQAADSGQQGN